VPRLERFHRLVDASAYWGILFTATVAFTGIYFGYAGLNFLATRWLLPKWRIGALLEFPSLGKG
jgi:hypothetical protein